MIIKKNQVGLSALDYATMANNPKIAAFLANILYIFGQDVLGKDSEGNTILHMMARKVRMYYVFLSKIQNRISEKNWKENCTILCGT